MLIDWFTVVAQIINFLVLVAILRFFLYDRVIRAMDRRQEAMDAGFREAEAREREAVEAAEEHRAAVEFLQTERQDRAKDIEAELEEVRRRMTDELSEDIARTRARWEGAVAANRDLLLGEIKRAVGRAADSVARQALTSLAGADLEDRVIATFLGLLAEADDDRRRAFRDSVDGEVVVLSTFEIGQDRRGDIETAIEKHLGHRGTVVYGNDPDLGSGIELRSGGFTLGWSINRYLDSVRQEFEDLIHQEESDE